MGSTKWCHTLPSREASCLQVRKYLQCNSERYGQFLLGYQGSENYGSTINVLSSKLL